MQFRFLLIGYLCIGITSWASAVDVFVTAAPGQPYGVASIEIPVDPPLVGRMMPPLEVTNAEGRVLYPIGSDVRVKAGRVSDRPVPQPGRGRLLGRVGNLIREITDPDTSEVEQTVARRVLFLIRGSEPIRVRLGDARGEIGEYEIVPDASVARAPLLNRWWSSYTDAVHRQIDAAKYPPLVENYLVAMLSGRLDLPLPDWYRDTTEQDDELLSTLQLVAGARGVSESTFRRAAAGNTEVSQTASLPLPAPPPWAPMFSSPDLDDVPVEPIATRVPPECFYIRYGSFANYLWFRDLSHEHGGDISRMVAVQGINEDATGRIERQLNLKQTELMRVFGGTVVEDQAIIGRDAFMTDGASIGVLLKSKNAFLMRTSLSTDRAGLAKSDPAVTLKNIKIGGQTATLLSSADNRVRSFMVEDDSYFFVTNSRLMAERFLEVGKSGESLAATSSFRLSRQLMPLDRNDTVFAYFSPAMLRGLVSPQTMIELRRRLYAKSDIALVHLARLAAAAEGNPITGIDELATAGFLPDGFGHRPDGSGVIGVENLVIDTARGARGTFLPIADVQIDAVTAEEAAWYKQIAAQYGERFPTIDPIMVGVQRGQAPGKDGVERLSIHAEVAPWEPEKYGWISEQLGPPTRVALKFAPDDIVAVQAHVASASLGPPTHLFAAIKDTVPPKPSQFEGILNIYRSLREIPGYLGAWPQPGALDRLPLGLGVGQSVGSGMSRLLGGLYRYSGGGFSILSFQPDVLQASLPFIAAEDVEDSAQIRGRVGDLHGSKIENWVNGQLYDLAAGGSAAGANFLGMLGRQLGVRAEDADAATKNVLGGTVQCTLGGQYQISAESGRWISTAWEGDVVRANAPPGYVAPVLKWLRGAEATVTQYEDRLVADGVIDIQRK